MSSSVDLNVTDVLETLVVPVGLARYLGIENAVLLAVVRDVLHEAKRTTGYEKDSAGYVRLTVEDIRKYAPWWSSDTVRRRLQQLVDAGYLSVTKSVESDPRDRALWYRLGG